MHLTTRRATVVGVSALAAVALSACSSDSDGSMPGMNHGSESMSSSTSGPASSGQEGDVMFAQMMIPHHQQAVEMADLALDDSSGASAKVQALAKDIKAAQGPEIQTMQGWLEQWGAEPASEGMGHGGMDHGDGMMSKSEMTDLESASGEKFDQMWLTMMIKHHQGAVKMAKDVQSTTSNSEVKTMAADIIKAQNSEITTMKDLL
ncbi:DUF305 domain-containing protein [Janibacter melonis]|uniref:DUF305 domain-containing protein n=1 Tax=Janibacter melonis TaxID=262209 RepID=UPI00174DDEBC|nr:DUF305 domain-containing protein [Janibacter melonis]